MNENDALALIMSLREDVWKNWGFLITFNTALWGWLIKRNGLHGINEKILATIGCTAFSAFILVGMCKIYTELDAATNELAYAYTANVKIPKTATPDGMVDLLIHKSPIYCSQLHGNAGKSKCGKYSDALNFTLTGILLGLIVSLSLCWMDSFWRKAREVSSITST